MTNNDDLLPAYSEPRFLGENRAFVAATIFYALYIFLSFIVFFMTLKIGGINFGSLFSSELMMVEVLTVRLLPIPALALFIARKRTGWILIMLLMVVELLYQAIKATGLLQPDYRFIENASPGMLLMGIIIFTLLISVFVLVLSKPVTGLFKITGTGRALTVIAGIIIFMVLKVYVTGFL